MSVHDPKVVDSQIHVWEREGHPDYPWRPGFKESRKVFLLWGPAITGDLALASMDAVGVDAAVVTSFMLYSGIDYAASVVREHPDRFCLAAHVDLEDDHPESVLERYCSEAPVSAVRLSFLAGDSTRLYARLSGGAYNRLLTMAEGFGLPVMLVVSGEVNRVASVVERYPDLTFFIDHLGVVQGPHMRSPEYPFADLHDLLDLSKYPNVAVKLSGAPTLSKEPYPYSDLWPYLHRIFDSFGVERVAWGSDFGRTRPLHAYSEAVDYIRYSGELSPYEKERVLGGNIMRLLSWPVLDRPER